MKKELLSLLSILTVTCAAAREKTDTTYWTRKGVAGLNLSQVSLTTWSAGGDGSVAFDALFNYNLDYKKDRHLWQNRLELAYGMSHTSSDGARKTNDKIYLSSTYGYEIAKNWYLSALLNFNTQFANGYDYGKSDRNFISRFMAPGYLMAGVGVTWTPKPWFTATITPATWRGTFVCSSRLSNEGAYGVDPGNRLLSEFGGNLRLIFNYEFLPNMNVYSRIDLFSDYLRKPANIDVRWDTQVTMKINKWFSASLNLNLIYDDDIRFEQPDGRTGARLQFKEVLGVGFQATF